MSRSEPIRVLCVDDNAEVLTALRVFLSRTPGFSCVGSLSVADGLAGEAADRQADVVLLDLRIPGTDPLDGLRELETLGGLAKVIVLSGYSDDDLVRQAVNAGASAFLSKDVDPDKLLETIRTIAM